MKETLKEILKRDGKGAMESALVKLLQRRFRPMWNRNRPMAYIVLGYGVSVIQIHGVCEWGTRLGLTIGRRSRISIGCLCNYTYKQAVKHWTGRTDRKRSLKLVEILHEEGLL